MCEYVEYICLDMINVFCIDYGETNRKYVLPECDLPECGSNHQYAQTAILGMNIRDWTLKYNIQKSDTIICFIYIQIINYT